MINTLKYIKIVFILVKIKIMEQVIEVNGGLVKLENLCNKKILKIIKNNY